jgi:hypothetical protein
MSGRSAVAALRMFVDAAKDLDRAWRAGGDVSLLATQYPRGLPRFDKLVRDLVSWRDAAVGVLEPVQAERGSLPAGWREGHEGDVVCPHRDCSVCRECAQRAEVVEVCGRHFWISDPLERNAMRKPSGGDAPTERRALPPGQLDALRRAAAGGGGLRLLRGGEWVPLGWAPANDEGACAVIVRFAPPAWYARTKMVRALERRGLLEGARGLRYVTDAGRAAIAAAEARETAGVAAAVSGKLADREDGS